MVYLQILCHLILIFALFETSKINYARVLVFSQNIYYQSSTRLTFRGWLR
jgi:hypothetical protein